MFRTIYTISVLICLIALTGCPDPVNPSLVSSFKGNIYFSSNNKIYKMELSNQTNSELFEYAIDPDITNDGRILAVEIWPIYRIIYSDITHAKVQTLIEREIVAGLEFKESFYKTRISYNQKYISYEGVRDYSAVYIVDASNGSLIKTFGNFKKNEPYFSPSWAPDGSLYLQGMTTINNGIYKVESDFSSIRKISNDLTNVSKPSVSPDGKSIAFIKDGQVWLMSIDGTNPTQLVKNQATFSNPTWSPDSKYIAVTSSSNHINIIDINSLTVTEITKTHYVAENSQMCWRY
jgi:Tol biopolymer transport system component